MLEEAARKEQQLAEEKYVFLVPVLLNRPWLSLSVFTYCIAFVSLSVLSLHVLQRTFTQYIEQIRTAASQ